MNAFKNLIHAAILAAWGVLGALFTFKLMFAAMPAFSALVTAGSFWIWFAGLAGVSTFIVSRFQSAVAAVLTHVGILLVLGMVPRIFPLNLLRLGLDLLAGQ